MLTMLLPHCLLSEPALNKSPGVTDTGLYLVEVGRATDDATGTVLGPMNHSNKIVIISHIFILA